MKTALVTGVSGQDGTYLAELLLSKGYRVVGTTRDAAGVAARLPVDLAGKIELLSWDLMDQQQLVEILTYFKPAEIYNCAAYSSGAGMYDDPVGIGEINGLAVGRILEVVRNVDPGIRICQASSSELFGHVSSSPQSEETAFCPRSPYGAAKLYAHSMINIYRNHFGLFACSAILFNHESPRRGLGFVTRKITHTAAQIKLGLAKELNLGNLEARRDWGFAGDTVNAMWLMLQAARAGAYIVATGETHTVREFCELAFGYLGLDYRDYVREDVAPVRLEEPVSLVGDNAKIKRDLSWEPRVSFADMVKIMVDADLHLLGANT